ncbi:MAG: DNA methyltransferase, partial [Methylococcaceae bacterium]
KAHLLPVPDEMDELPDDEEGDGEEQDDENVGLQVMPTYIYKQAQSSVKLMRQIFDGKKVFANPKDHEVLSRLIRYVGSRDALILDSFAGSGTTAHAVLEANKLDNGNRRFILIETMDYAETITAERVRRVMNGYGKGKKAVYGLGGSFDYFTVGEPIFNEEDTLNELVGLDAIRNYVAYSEGIPSEHRTDPSNPHSPHLLGRNAESAWIFYYEPDNVTCLDLDFLSTLKLGAKPGTTIIYADKCLLSKEFMANHGIFFKKIPRDITRF